MNTKITLLFLAIISSNLKSQNIYLGVKLGVSSMYVTESLGSLKGDYDIKTGFNIGMISEFEVSKYFSIQPELNYTNKGYKFNQGQSIDIRLSYFEIPLLLKPKFPIKEVFEFYGEFGPSLSIGVGGEAKVNNQTYTGLFDAGGYKRLDMGLNYGGGFNVKLNSGYKFGLGVRFFKGLSELYPSNQQNISGRNNGLIIAVSLAQTL